MKIACSVCGNKVPVAKVRDYNGTPVCMACLGELGKRLPMVEAKKCARCERVKMISMFSLDSYTRKPKSWCKECCAEYTQEWREKVGNYNERQREYMREWRRKKTC